MRPASPFSLRKRLGRVRDRRAVQASPISTRARPFTGGAYGGKQSIYQVSLNWYPVTNVPFLLDYLIAGVERKASPGAPAGQIPGMTNLGTSFQAVVVRTQVKW